MQQFFSLFTAQPVSGVFPPIIRSSMTVPSYRGDSRAVFVVAGRPDHENSTTVTTIRR